MSGVSLKIVAAGPALTIQDRGRPGYLGFGVSAGGAMDRYALAEGQALLGNGADSAAIEMTGTGGRFTAEGGDLWIALTGAPFRASVEGVAQKWRAAFLLKAGNVLEIGPATGGNWHPRRSGGRPPALQGPAHREGRYPAV